MNGVRKNSGVIRLLMAAALVLFVAACGSSSGIKNDRDMYKDMAAELQTQLDTANSELDTANSDLVAARANLAMTKTSLTATEDELETAEALVIALETQVLGLEGEKTALGGRITDLDGQVSGLEGEKTALEGRITDLDGQVSGLEGEKTALEGRITDLDGRVTGLTGQVTMLTSERDGLQGRLNTLLADGRPEDTRQIRELEGRIDDLGGQIVTLKTDLNAAETALDGDGTPENTGLRQEFEDLKLQLAHAETALDGDGTPENTGLRQEFEDLKQQLADAETELDGDGTPENPGLRQQLADAETELDGDGTPENPGLRQELADAETALDGDGTPENTGLRQEFEDLKQQLADAETELEGDGTADNPGLRQQVADLEEELDTLKQEAKDAEADEQRKMRIAAEKKIRTAIELEANQAASTDLTGARGFTVITAKRDAAEMVTVTVSEPEDDDYDGGTSSAATNGWTGTTLTKKDNTLVIYTDVDASTDESFIVQYTQEERDDILLAPDHLKKAKSSTFPTGLSETVMFDGTALNDNLSGNPASFAGTFDDVSGTFECVADSDGPCTLETNAKGELQPSSNWRFTPNSNLATVKDPDAAYVWFGWWLNNPKTGDFDVEVFTGSSPANHLVDAGAINALEGTASYIGSAAGKFASKDFSAGVQTDAGVGHFAATARLSADFDDGTDPGSITGTISEFTLNGTDSVPWSVSLEEAALDAAVFTGMTKVDFGGGLNPDMVGDWNGSFYDAAEESEDAPGAVAGKFDVETPGASLLGAFGASVTE